MTSFNPKPAGRKVENRNFFVFYPICLKFDAGGNFEMLIAKRKPKLKLENDLSKKLQCSTDFNQNVLKKSQALFNNSVAMATVNVPWDTSPMGLVCIQSERLLVCSEISIDTTPLRNTFTNHTKYKFDQTDREVFESVLEEALGPRISRDTCPLVTLIGTQTLS